MAEVADELGDEVLAHIPLVGCDGTPSGGALVDQGRLAGTVRVGRPGAAAIEWVDAVLSGRRRPPGRVALPAAPYPD